MLNKQTDTRKKSAFPHIKCTVDFIEYAVWSFESSSSSPVQVQFDRLRKDVQLKFQNILGTDDVMVITMMVAMMT